MQRRRPEVYLFENKIVIKKLLNYRSIAKTNVHFGRVAEIFALHVEQNADSV